MELLHLLATARALRTACGLSPTGKKSQEIEKARKQEEETLAARDLAEKAKRERELEHLKGRIEDMKAEDSSQAYSKNNDREGTLLLYKSSFF